MIMTAESGSELGVALPPPLQVAVDQACAELLQRAELALSIKELGGGTYVYANRPMVALLALQPFEVVGRTDAQLFEPLAASAVRAGELAALGRSGPSGGELKLDRAGATREFQVWRVPITLGDAAAPTHLASLWVEQTQAKRQAAQLQLALMQLEQQQRANDILRREMTDGALRDVVTGLATRGHFDDQLRREVDLSTREHREFALAAIAIDPPIDAVKAGGDAARTRVVEALGRLLRGNTRAMDASCRWDEGRFAVLLSGVGLATAHSRMEQLRRQCATQIVVLEGRELGFTVSMGVASYPHTANSQEGLIDACEEALAQARQRGGNTVALASIRFDPGS
jgi:diguanylate cyclase (GGDEF)-like protein